ncbi:MAG: D-alanyl-D-alanine carboxypeptidase [Clostridiales bacterium]|nr:D-alanyl-D-alanine carboxypeptidase [Clostridiales bacterium]
MYVWSNRENAISTTSSNTTCEGNFLNITSGSATLIEQSTGQILYEHNSHEQLRPASVTKVMTILLIMEALDNGTISLEDNVPCSEKASSMGGSQIWLDTSETLTVHEMLKAICVVSANDCCVAMAEFLAGSEELFVEQMNLKAKELGMNDTCFKNCHGIDEDGHLTSSNDIAIMSRELLSKHPKITEYTTIWMDSLRNGESELVNTNKIIRNYNGATGLKTGSTSLALFNLSASATRDGLSLIAVIMKGETSAVRFSEAQKLLDYGFSNYEFVQCAKAGDIVKTIEINKGTVSSVDVIYETDSGALIKKGEKDNVTTQVVLDEKISAPISEGQKLGEIHYLLNDDVIATTNLIAKQEVKKLTLVNMFTHTFGKWFSLLR